MNNTIPQKYIINREMRSRINGHRSMVIWFIGLSGSGKSTIANLVEKALFEEGIHTYSLDGDNIRSGLNKDLGFTSEERSEKVRRTAEVAKLFLESGIVILAAFITPLERDREMIREIVGKENYTEIFVNTSLEECEKRDVKGLYKKARAGEIKNFTGIDSPFEVPKEPELIIDTKDQTVEDSVEEVLQLIKPTLRIKNE